MAVVVVDNVGGNGLVSELASCVNRASRRVVVVTGPGTVRNLLNHLGSDQHLVGQRSNDRLDRSGPLLVVSNLVGGHGFREGKKEASGDLQGEKNGNREEVEHIVDGGSGESALELVSVAEVSHRNNGVRHGSADVGSHDDKDGKLDINDCGNKSNNNRSGG